MATWLGATTGSGAICPCNPSVYLWADFIEEDLLPRLPIAPMKLGHRGELDLTPPDRPESTTTSVGKAAMAGKKLPTGRVGRTVRLAGLAGHTVATRAQTRVHSRACGDAAEAAELARQERLAERTPRSSAI